MGWWNPETKWMPREDMAPYIKNVAGFRVPKSYGEKIAKRTLGDIDAGRDVSDMGYFNPIAQQQAVDEAGVDFDYATGANALIMNSGAGDQAALLQAMKDKQKLRIKDNAGMQRVHALADLRDSSMRVVNEGSRFRHGMRYNAALDAARLQEGAGRWETTGGWGQSLVNSAISGATGALVGGFGAPKPKVPQGYGSWY